MATEVNLKPGWLSRDARRAADRVHEWSTPKDASTRRSERQEPDRAPVESGEEHYRSSRVILGDVERDAFFTANGFRVIRIPYFVQLSRAVIAHLFGDIAHTTNDFLDFPHGFIASTVVMPADFCELGIARFDDDLKRFGYIAGAILQILTEAAAARGDWRTVYPPSRYGEWGVQSAMPSTTPLPRQSAESPGSLGSGP